MTAQQETGPGSPGSHLLPSFAYEACHSLKIFHVLWCWLATVMFRRRYLRALRDTRMNITEPPEDVWTGLGPVGLN